MLADGDAQQVDKLMQHEIVDTSTHTSEDLQTWAAVCAQSSSTGQAMHHASASTTQ